MVTAKREIKFASAFHVLRVHFILLTKGDGKYVLIPPGSRTCARSRSSECVITHLIIPARVWL